VNGCSHSRRSFFSLVRQEPEEETDQGCNQAPPSVAARWGSLSSKHVEKILHRLASPVDIQDIFVREEMELLYHRCCGIDVHKKLLVACLILVIEGRRHKEIRTFATTTQGILQLHDWLQASGCTHVAMESTGV